jgi:uncharacterized membrane protein
MVLCVFCGIRNASFVCHNCGRIACRECFDTTRWWCTGCSNQLGSAPIGTSSRARVPVSGLLFSLAFIMIFVGILLMTLGPLFNGGTIGPSGGTIILIGPIPIILGSGPFSGVMVVLALVLTVFALILFGVILRRPR